jgi:hypothetical protein
VRQGRRSPASAAGPRIVSGMVARVVESPADVPVPLPPGLTVVPVQDPLDFARALAARTGGTLVSSAGEVAAVLARRRVTAVADNEAVATEAAWLRSLIDGGRAELPPRLAVPGERTATLRALADDLSRARDATKHARVALLKREAAVQAEVRKAGGVVLDIEPELARRVAHRVNVTLRRARAAKRALGPKPAIDRDTEQAARRAMSRLEDAGFAASRARAKVHTRLAVGNVLGLLLVLLAVLVVWTGTDIDAPSVYAVFALSGLCPLVALAIGGVGAAHARRRVQAAKVACDEALRRAGVDDAEALAERRRELEEWLDRADATAAARDAWHDAKAAWEAMAGPDADPRTVEELLEAGARVRAAREKAAEARGACEEASAALAAAEEAVRARLAALGAAAPAGDDHAPIVVTGSGLDRIAIEKLEPPLPVALVTSIDASARMERMPESEPELPEPEPGPRAEAADEGPPAGTVPFVLDPESARRLRRRVRRLR